MARFNHWRSATVWLSLWCMAPTCQQTNPAFQGAEGTDGTSGGVVTTTMTTAVATTADVPGPTTGGGDGGSSTGGGSASTSDADGSSSSAGPDSGSTAAAGTGTGTSGGTGDTGCPGTVCPVDGCVDLQTDPDNCGKCGEKCNPAQEQCVDAACVPN